MSKYIETNDKYENRKRVVQRTKCRPIYEVIDEDYIKNSHIFPDDFIIKCKQFPNVPQSISVVVKNNIKRMAMEQSLYAHVINFRRKDLLFYAADKNKNESTFKFQGQSARSQLWFDLDLDWIDMNFSTREPDFYKKIFQSHDIKQEKDTFKTFQVPIGNAKFVKSFMFYKDAPILSYCQKTLNSCCFSSLAPAFASIKHFKAFNAICIHIK